MNALATVAPKLSVMIARLASTHQGEQLAVIAAIGSTLRSAGADWNDLAGRLSAPSEPSHEPDTVRDIAHWCLSRGGGTLSEREEQFLENMLEWREPSAAQRRWLSDIFAKLGGAR
jgi:hypothetical protein